MTLVSDGCPLTCVRRQWVYYGAAIGNSFIMLMCFYMRESRPALVLRHHVHLIEKATSFKGLALDDDLRLPTIREFTQHNLILPYAVHSLHRAQISTFC